jgi:uncharacterized protein YkwD
VKRWTSLALSILLAGSSAQGAAAADRGIQVLVNGVHQTFEQPPVVVNGSTLVPLSGILEALDARIQWHESTGTVIASKDGNAIVLQTDSKLTELSGQNGGLETAAQLIDGITMVPVRFVSESLGMLVAWDAQTNSVLITLDEPLYGRTKQQIISKINAYAPLFQGDPYEVQPQISNPHQPGKLSPQFIEDGVRTANLMRYLAGLPDDVVQDASLNEQAQYGAVLLADNGKLSHTPEKPEGMDDSFYNKGFTSASTSNIYSIYGTSTVLKTASLLPKTVASYMSDADDFNVAAVGHRRWILYPPLKKVGFGLAEGREVNGYKSLFSPMQIFDKSRTEHVHYETVTWPGKGYFPTNYFLGNDPWSVSLNPDRFTKPSLEEISVQLTRLNDQTIWTFDKDNHGTGNGSAYFNVDTNGYGVPYCIVFRPDAINEYKDGERFEVRVNGIKDKQGNAADVSYEVVFFTVK